FRGRVDLLSGEHSVGRFPETGLLGEAAEKLERAIDDEALREVEKEILVELDREALRSLGIAAELLAKRDAPSFSFEMLSKRLPRGKLDGCRHGRLFSLFDDRDRTLGGYAESKRPSIRDAWRSETLMGESGGGAMRSQPGAARARIAEVDVNTYSQCSLSAAFRWLGSSQRPTPSAGRERMCGFTSRTSRPDRTRIVRKKSACGAKVPSRYSSRE